MVKKPPVNAGDMGSIPCPFGKIPHATQQLSPRAAIPEAGALDLGCNKTVSRSHCSYRQAQEQQQDPAQPKINALTKSINQDERKFTKSKDATYKKDRTVTNLCVPNNLKS